jgi:alkanesulfonate monooxygenase SsuD/methylene tetrahydromethanopterin reductase-like flavin-dependent oxidoreductase (luciferase family)
VTDEAIQVLKALWTQQRPVFKGRFFGFEGIDAQPRPVQKPHPPIVVGGLSRPAARRAARFGDGWYGFLTDFAATERILGWIREAIERGERGPELGELEISVTPPPPITPDVIRRYEDLGVHRLVALFGAKTVDDATRFTDELGALARA